MYPSDFGPGGYLKDYLLFWAIWVAFVGGTVWFFRRTRGRTGRLRLVAGNALVLACLLWTAVVAGETYFRWFYDQTDSFGLLPTNWTWFRAHVLENTDGFRDREWPRGKRPGVERVACVGDSFTMGWGIRELADCWPQRLGAGLEARAPGRFETRTYAIPGLPTSQEAALIDRRVSREGVDRVILGYCLNDTDDLLPPDRWFNREEAPQVPFLKNTTSFLADFLWFRLKQRQDPRVRDYFGYEKEAYDDPKIWAAQRAQFRHIAETCRASGMKLHVIVFPFFQSWGDDYPFGACHDKVVAAWRELGVEAIDLRDAYRGIPATELVVNRFDAHPNERACAIAADVALQRIFGFR